MSKTTITITVNGSDYQLVEPEKCKVAEFIKEKAEDYNERAGFVTLPILAAIRWNDKTWNKASDVRGTTFLVPVELKDDNGDAGFTQATYRVAHYRDAFTVRAGEERMAKRNPGNISARVAMMTESFRNLIASHVYSNEPGADERMQGIGQVVACDQTVGGISQETCEAWKAHTVGDLGCFTLDAVMGPTSEVRGNVGPRAIDNILCSSLSSNDLYGKLLSCLSPGEHLVDSLFTLETGLKNIVFNGSRCIQDRYAQWGTLFGLSADSWFYRGDDSPQLSGFDRITGTDAKEAMFSVFAGIGCNAPAANFKVTGIS